MKAQLCALLLVGLAGQALAGLPLGDNGLTTYSGRRRENDTLVFGNQMLIDQAMQAAFKMSGEFLTGTWKPTPNDPATEKKEVYVECLNSVAPPPLNWQMWCPGKDAKVMGWTDKSGAAHRSITLRPQKGMTAHMAQWFITSHVMGLMPPVVEFQGNKYYYYHLWHPLDHVEAAWALGPAVPGLQKGPPLWTLIHERYRQPQGWNLTRHYETNGWFYVQDSLVNLMKNRYVITMPLMGLPTWTMIIEFNDTPEGLVVDIEVVAGIPSKGFDERDPSAGFKAAAGMNELFTAPIMASQKGNLDWEESINAITRHAIEEFSNLQFFVPTIYERFYLLGANGINFFPTLGTWMQYNGKTARDEPTVSFYNNLVSMSKMTLNISETALGKGLVAGMGGMAKLYEKATDAAVKINEATTAPYAAVHNAVTKAAYDANAANGAHPERDLSVPKVKKMLVNATVGTLRSAGVAVPEVQLPRMPSASSLLPAREYDWKSAYANGPPGSVAAAVEAVAPAAANTEASAAEAEQKPAEQKPAEQGNVINLGSLLPRVSMGSAKPSAARAQPAAQAAPQTIELRLPTMPRVQVGEQAKPAEAQAAPAVEEAKPAQQQQAKASGGGGIKLGNWEHVASTSTSSFSLRMPTVSSGRKMAL